MLKAVVLIFHISSTVLKNKAIYIFFLCLRKMNISFKMCALNDKILFCSHVRKDLKTEETVLSVGQHSSTAGYILR